MVPTMGTQEQVCDSCGATKGRITSSAVRADEFAPRPAGHVCPNGCDRGASDGDGEGEPGLAP